MLTKLTSGGSFLLLKNSCSKLMLHTKKLNMARRHYCRVMPVINRPNKTFYERTGSSENQIVTFEHFLNHRKSEAQKSIVVHVQSLKSLTDLNEYCSQYGKVNGIHHYINPKSMHCAIVDFRSIESVKNLMANVIHVNKEQIVPSQSSFLWFRNNILQKSASNSKNYDKNVTTSMQTVKIQTEQQINDMLLGARTVSNQIATLYRVTKLNDVETRLRFITANQLENSLLGLFPLAKVLPFGSSVSGFGKQGCDLDLVMSLESNLEDMPSKRLVYLTKASNDENSRITNIMETLASNMQYLMPCITNVKRILHARVPIIKYSHSITGLECDLSMTNMTGIYMTELLYLFGQIDYRVRPLVFTIKKWASIANITNSIPGPRITNFPLSLFVIFYLQQVNVLPTVKYLKELAGKNDIRIADNHVDCTFVRDVKQIKRKQTNESSLEDLLIGFFQYYSEFDFNTRAISIRDGKAIIKPNNAALYICNPLETTLNASKNVSSTELENLQVAMVNSLKTLSLSSKNSSHDWGLVSIFNKTITINKNKLNINLRQLMQGDENNNGTRKSENTEQTSEQFQDHVKQIKRS